MNTAPAILAFASSARINSLNKKLVQVAANGAVMAGASVTFIDLKDYPLPLYDGDIDTPDTFPANVLRLREILIGHQGLLIASPEYNGSIPPLLKNLLDWTSRQPGGKPELTPYTGKVATLMSTSPGGYGGLRGLTHVRTILGNMGVIVLPEQLAVPKGGEAFDAAGLMPNANQRAAVEALGANMAQLLSRLHGLSLVPQSGERRHDFTRIR